MFTCRRNSSQITCITPQQFLPLSVPAKLTADDSNEISTRDNYIYIENPSVNTVDPKISLVRLVKLLFCLEHVLLFCF